MAYVDGFVLAVPRDKLDAYVAIAQRAGAIWMEYGALEYVECVGDDISPGELTSFPRAVLAQDDEVVVLAWIRYRSREHRDDVLAKVMADERIKAEMADIPFDAQRMFWGGFKPVVEM